jgi:DNA topoisomerase-1
MSSKKYNLVIVESVAKCKIIKKYLSSIPEFNNIEWSVQASFGHIRELDKKNGVEIENGFKMNYINSPDKLKVISSLKKEVAKADLVYLASDLDLEGEAIALALKEVLKLKKYKRITFNEITKDALKTAVINAGDIDMDACHAQESRRVLDRITGFKLTACLWKAFTSNRVMSAGRVQSVGLKIIVDKEREIEKFKSSSYYKINGSFEINKIKIDNSSLYQDTTILKIETNKIALDVLQKLIKYNNKFYIKDINDKNSNEKPPLPYITSSLQIEASGKLHMSIKGVMSTAQQLYEKGFITYMRTDSYNLSEQALNDIQKYIITNYGENNYKRRYTSKKSKGSQEAHEAIRCSNVSVINTELSDQHQKLYEMIRNRTIASQMIDATYREGSVKVGNKKLSENLYFLGKTRILIRPGYLEVYNIKPDKMDVDLWLNTLRNSNSVNLMELEALNTWSVPPSRYSEATLIKVLETEGVGRPSTYASIIGKLYERGFIEKKDVFGKKMKYIHYKYKASKKNIDEIEENKELYQEKSKLVPLDSGIQITDFLEKNFSEIINVGFTSDMELSLDKIAEHKLDKLKFLNGYYKHFSELLKSVVLEKTKNSLVNIKNNKTFNINGKEYIVREGKYGALIETMNGDKKEYTGLKPYLTLIKKNLEDINEEDVKFVLKFPVKIGKKDNIDAFLVIGPYGFYIKYNEKNYKIPYKIKNEILNMKSYNSLMEHIY